MASDIEPKICPQCQASVRDSVQVCRHCRHEFAPSLWRDLMPAFGYLLPIALCVGFVWMALH